jgi:F0F1-type ATP synthase assembly protein I
VALTYGAGIGERRKAGHDRLVRLPPVALIGSGLIGIGAAVLLVLVAARRMGLD